jgi:hypothetical protein
MHAPAVHLAVGRRGLGSFVLRSPLVSRSDICARHTLRVERCTSTNVQWSALVARVRIFSAARLASGVVRVRSARVLAQTARDSRFVCRHGHRMRARVGAIANNGRKCCNRFCQRLQLMCRLRTTQRNFQLHPPRKSGHLCAVAFRLVRPSFELKCWNFGQPEKLEKGETK